jgi:hypothetical protein
MKVKPYIILNTSRKNINYEEDKNKVPLNKPYNIKNTNICNGIFHISFFKALLINALTHLIISRFLFRSLPNIDNCYK